MSGQPVWDVVVVGAGFAGLSTALWARRLGLSAVVLERESREGGSLLRIAGPIIDYPGVVAAGAELADALRSQLAQAGAGLLPGRPVQRVDAAARTCWTAEGPVQGRALVLATGLSPRRLGVSGEELVTGRRPSREPEWFRGRRVAVIGGGDRAAENALLLAETAAAVWLIHRRDALRAMPEFQQQLLASPVTMLLGTAVTALEAQGQEMLVRLDGQEPLPVDVVCAYIGNRPNTGLVEGQVLVTSDGYVATDRHGQTDLPGVYAAGDVCTASEYQSLATATGQAMIVAKHIALHIDR
jgi:thioredoxin reductase (NADPH)